MEPNPTLVDLLLEWEEREEQGRLTTPEELCRDCPEHLEELRRRIDRLRALSPLLDLTAAAQTAELPFTIPGFEILDPIASGGMGMVYRARDTTLDRIVAIKIPRQAALNSPRARKRFEREARVLAQLRHPNIVPIHAAGLVEGQPYIVMDFVPGGSLAQKAAQFAADPQRIAALVETVARAIDHAHQNHVIHRDLKPSNILLDEYGQPMVSDFGVAGLRHPEGIDPDPTSADGPHDDDTPIDNRLTLTNDQVGTPSHMAPEQFSPQVGPADRAADVWAMGVMLYQLLTGRLPFVALGGQSLREVIGQTPPPRPRALRPDLDRRLEAIVLKCLAKEPARRYGTALALADDLARWRRSERWRRHLPRIVLAAATFAAATLMALWFFWPQDPEAQHLAKLQSSFQALDRKEPIELIGDDGLVSHRVRFGQPSTQVMPAEMGVFSVVAQKIALVEFLPELRVDRYVIIAEIREDGSHGHAELGLFFGYRPIATAKGGGHLFGCVRFADLGPKSLASLDERKRPCSKVNLNFVHFLAPGPPARKAIEFNKLPSFYVPPEVKPNGPGPWRTLALQVTPEAVTGTFDGVPLMPLNLKDSRAWLQTTEDLASSAPPVPEPFWRAGGVGLYVNGCQASIRKFRVEPLDEP